MTHQQHYQPADFAPPRSRPTGSPRWLVITRDVLISLVAAMLVAAVVAGIVAVAVHDSRLSDATTPSTSPSNVPPVCYVQPDDPSCPPGFTP